MIANILNSLKAILYVVTSSGPYKCVIIRLSVEKIIIAAILIIKNWAPNFDISFEHLKLISVNEGLIFL